jgi:hypothetical protein
MSAEYASALKPIIEVLNSVAKVLKKRYAKKKCGLLMSEAISELLKERPDLNTAQAKLALAKALEIEPSAELFRTEEMFVAAKSYAVHKVSPRYGTDKGPKRKARAKLKVYRISKSRKTQRKRVKK